MASWFEVLADRVKEIYGSARVHSSAGMPAINGGPANPVANPQVAVIELFQDEEAFGNFRSPGFNILVDVDAMDANRHLVKET